MAQLTSEQLQAFEREGYLILPNVFSEEEVRLMRREADHILELVINSSIANRRKSSRLDWSVTQSGRQVVRKVQPTNDLSLFLTRVSQDERFIGPMRELMGGEEPVLMEEKLNYKQPLPEPVEGVPIHERDDHFPVHNDWAYYAAQDYPQSIISSAVTMDPCTADNGPLRVWPGSHKTHLEHHQAQGRGLEVLPELIDHGGGQDVLCPAGSVLLFSSLLVHNSRPNLSANPRRLMIYSHFPKADGPGKHGDIRNGPARLRESPWERQYLRMKLAGAFTDVFHAPEIDALPAAEDDVFIMGDGEAVGPAVGVFGGR